MWPGFDPTPYTRETWMTHVKVVSKKMGWRPVGITLHNTGIPTLGQWVELGPKHDARLRNLESYYEKQLGWHHGPHAFVSRSAINGFSPLTQVGVHSTCFNRDHFGIEMVGNFEPGADNFASGDGALVRDNAVWALACLCRVFKFDPDLAINFHRDCAKDHHACPGSLVTKDYVIGHVKSVLTGMGP